VAYTCETVDFIYPLLADIYYPIVEQTAYGNVKKQWILDKTISCNFSAVGAAGKEEIKPNVNITKDMVLMGRTRQDVRVSSLEVSHATTNILITNIRDSNKNPIYLETTGPRAGNSTIFELATQEPTVGPFGVVELYKLVIKRSENQGSDV
jgi:hypothetical protein